MPCSHEHGYSNAGSIACDLVRKSYPHLLRGSTAFNKLVEKYRRKIAR